MAQNCEGCGHSLSRHFMDVTNTVRCLIVESNGIGGLRGDVPCDCTDYVSDRAKKRRAHEQAEDERRQGLLREAIERAREAPPVDRTAICTTSGEPPDKVRSEQTEPAGQHKAYVVLCDEERAKGWVRPYRDAYKHVGQQPTYPTRELTAEEHERYDQYGYVAYEPYPEGSGAMGKFWTAAQLKGGCGTVTTMGRKLSETYARDPKFYGSTFCCGCNVHLPVSEFVWTADNERVGS